MSRPWRPEASWMPRHVPGGFPVIVVGREGAANDWVAVLTARGVKCRKVATVDEATAGLFKGVQVLFGYGRRGFTYQPDYPYDTQVLDWHVTPWTSGTAHSDAYAKYVNMPLAATADVMGILGPYVWDDFDKLVSKAVPRGEVDSHTWELFWQFLDKGRASEAVRVGDLGTAYEPRAGSYNVHDRMRERFEDSTKGGNDPGIQPVRQKSKPLWKRDKFHKRRHYFDIATLLVLAIDKWTSEGHGPKFKDVAKQLLRACVAAEMSYERMYLTLFWLLTSPYWAELSNFVLDRHLLYLDDEDWRAAFKEVTAQVTRTWFFPGTNVQVISSAYFINAEDLVGHPDPNVLAGAVSLEILDFAVNNLDTTFINRKGRSFEAHLDLFSRAVELLLEPIYQQFANKAMTYDELLETRAVWGTTSAETALKNHKDGITRSAPPGKQNQLSEELHFMPLRNRSPEVGREIGECPRQAMKRYLNSIIGTEGLGSSQYDGVTLLCWDWRAWDHYVHCVERRLMLNAMERLTERYVCGPALPDILAELQQLKAGTDELICKSRWYAAEQYKKQVDEMISVSGGSASRLNNCTGRFAVSVKMPLDQQLDRRSLLSGTSNIDSSRLVIWDSWLIPGSADVRHRTSMFVCNRADDVAEILRSMNHAEAVISTALAQDHKTDSKEEVTQIRSMVYLRSPRPSGSIRAFPVRAMYAAATAHPDKIASIQASYAAKLRSLAKALDTWARCGGWIGMARVLYDDALKFFSKTRVWQYTAAGGRAPVDVRVPREIIEASPERGGLGISPPGVYRMDDPARHKSADHWHDVSKAWEERLERYVTKIRASQPGSTSRNLTVRPEDFLERETGEPSTRKTRRDLSDAFEADWRVRKR
ncbi:hypothetical protein N7539_004396 [Penicillium diatomitis]|uniref:Uncharacterized protein n=1 Tax=Penicillium diatomitis TaxID=2819901 RepID=A0A9X0BY51_9EURO|nr:uncharacterized protein N7539_004396 [Penicillium diatomitis]KAJ5489506.1 hypothetical protein N7539_004396 [Penicillium diatomitis]